MRIITGSLPNDYGPKPYNIDLKFSLLRQRMNTEQAVAETIREMRAIGEDFIYSANPMFFNYLEVVHEDLVECCYYIDADGFLRKIIDNSVLANNLDIMHLGEVVEDSTIIWWYK